MDDVAPLGIGDSLENHVPTRTMLRITLRKSQLSIFKMHLATSITKEGSDHLDLNSPPSSRLETEVVFATWMSSTGHSRMTGERR